MSESPSNCVAKASGQNVNKVNTKVHLVLPMTAIGGITEEERERLRVKLSSILNKDDCLFWDVDG